MSRPILSRPRTRVYGCNYDKGESYYKPMVDHLDRKYSSRPLFSEPRTSFADEIAARRSDIGSRGDHSGARSSPRDLDLEFDIPRSRGHASSNVQDTEDETVYDIRGQRSTRRSTADDFASEIAATTRRFKAHSSIGLDDQSYAEFRRSDEKYLDPAKNARIAAKSAFEEAENSFKRRSKLLNEEAHDRIGEEKSALTRWSKIADEDDISSIVGSAAAGRAKQTKARLNDLETEMEEMAERQAKRERRSAALRALVNENTSSGSDEQFQQQQSSLTTKRVTESSWPESGSRSLADSRTEECSIDDLDFYNEPRDYEKGDRPEDDSRDIDDFIMSHRRMKQRATEAFERDLVELRKKRRDMQDKMFDMIDMNAEIERAKCTLEGANSAFSRHAIKFDNSEPRQPEPMTLAEEIDRNRKIQAAALDSRGEQNPRPRRPMFQWTKMEEIEKDPAGLVQGIYNRRARINSIVAERIITDEKADKAAEDNPRAKAAPKEKTKKKRSVIKKKKNVSF